jgi:hypothetical protein
MPGLVFPMMVALAWGWRYGLVSATLGLGCQTLWFVWLTDGGAQYLVTIPMLTLWVVWHGWCASRSGKVRFPIHNIYLAEIPFRLCNTVVLYTVLYVALQWQPPTWMLPGQSGKYYLDLIHFRAIEQMVNGYIVLFIADILLSLGPVRRLFGLKIRRGQVDTDYVIIAALLFGLMFWVIDGLADYYKFREHLRFLIFEAPENALDAIVFNVSSPDLFARTAFVTSCLAGGILVSRLLRRQMESAAALEASEARYRRLHQTMRDAFVQYEDQLDEKAHKFIQYAVDGAARMQILIRDLLAFSRVETCAQGFKPVGSRWALNIAIANLID